jgi:hypothetical protein
VLLSVVLHEPFMDVLHPLGRFGKIFSQRDRGFKGIVIADDIAMRHDVAFL